MLSHQKKSPVNLPSWKSSRLQLDSPAKILITAKGKMVALRKTVEGPGSNTWSNIFFPRTVPYLHLHHCLVCQVYIMTNGRYAKWLCAKWPYAKRPNAKWHRSLKTPCCSGQSICQNHIHTGPRSLRNSPRISLSSHEDDVRSYDGSISDRS